MYGVHIMATCMYQCLKVKLLSQVVQCFIYLFMIKKCTTTFNHSKHKIFNQNNFPLNIRFMIGLPLQMVISLCCSLFGYAKRHFLRQKNYNHHLQSCSQQLDVDLIHLYPSFHEYFIFKKISSSNKYPILEQYI